MAAKSNVVYRDEVIVTVDEQSFEKSATIKPYFADIVAGEPSQVVKNTQLIEAAIFGDTLRISELLRQGADHKTAQNSPLRLAAANGHAKSVQVLVDAGANAADREALVRAAKAGYADVVAILVRYTDGPARSEAIKVASHGYQQTPGAFGAGQNTPHDGHARSIKILKTDYKV